MGPTLSEGNQHCCHGSSLQQVPSCPRSLWGLHPPPWLKAARWLRDLHAHAQPPTYSRSVFWLKTHITQ